MFCLVGCARGWAVHTRTPDTSARQEGGSLIVLGTIELAAGGGIAAFCRYMSEHSSSPAVEPGSEGHGLSGDGTPIEGGSGDAGPVAYFYGGVIGGFALIDIATGIYEVVSGRFVETTVPFRRRR